jgi:hypothetical protein
MHSKYIILIDKGIKLPNIRSLFNKAWGHDLPISFIRDAQDLESACFVDVKVNKWEANEKWSGIQLEEPWIRIEIVRNQALEEFIMENEIQGLVDSKKMFLIALELDGQATEIDRILIGYLVKAIADTHRAYIYDESYQYIDCSEYLQSLPPAHVVIEKLFMGEDEF